MWTAYDKNGTPITREDNLGLRSIQTFTANGTYTTPAGVRAILVMGIGGGGGGASPGAGNSTQIPIATGGNSGAVGSTYIPTPNATYTVTIGKGGTAGNGGGTSSFGGGSTSQPVGGYAQITFAGGNAGVTIAIGLSLVSAGPAEFGSVGQMLNVLNGRTSQLGGYATRISGTVASAGDGGSSLWGAGGQGTGLHTTAIAAATGGAGTGYGAGGGGGTANATTAGTGGAGSDGFIIVYEFQ
jgi:hypothetical protein